MRVIKLSLRFLVQNARFAHKSSTRGPAAKDKQQAGESSFVYEDLARSVNRCQLEISRFVSFNLYNSLNLDFILYF